MKFRHIPQGQVCEKCINPSTYDLNIITMSRSTEAIPYTCLSAHREIEQVILGHRCVWPTDKRLKAEPFALNLLNYRRSRAFMAYASTFNRIEHRWHIVEVVYHLARFVFL